MATYKIKPGDTLSAIAKSHNTTVDAIAKENGITNVNKIYAGNTLKIGETAKSKPAKTTAPATTTAPASTTTAPKGFTYEIPESKWSPMAQEALDKYLNREDFSYDLNGDALYQMYKDQAVLGGNMAMMDTMGQAAALNGGYGSSYAQTVGQQTYQSYLQQLNDKVPELYQIALNQYNQEGQDLKDAYSLYSGLEQLDYDRAMDKMDIEHTLWREGIEDQRYEEETAYKKESEAKQYAYNLAIGAIEMGLMPKDDVLAQAGISPELARSMVSRVQSNQNAAKNATGSNKNSQAANQVTWISTGTVDDNGYTVYRNSKGQVQSFGKGVSPYTGNVNPDILNKQGELDSSKVMSNGYQPNNVGGRKVYETEWIYTPTGEPIWQAWEGNVFSLKDAYYVWDASKNRYEKVDTSEIRK